MMGFRMFAQGRIQNFVPEVEGVPMGYLSLQGGFRGIFSVILLGKEIFKFPSTFPL